MKKISLFVLTFGFCFFPALGLADFESNLSQMSSSLDQVQGVVNQAGDIASGLRALSGGNSANSVSSSNSSGAGMFNPDTVFPAWGDGGQVTGVIGTNGGALNQGQGRLLIYFIPKIIELMIWVVAPLVTLMFIYAGLQYIWGGDQEEEIKKSHDFFRMAVVGLIFVVLSYSIMKAVFFILV